MRWAVAAFLAGLLLAGCSSTTDTTDATATTPTNAPATAKLPDVTLAGLSGGKPIELAGLHGVPTVINLWASWCGPCKAELPLLAKAHDKFGDRVRMLGIDFADDSPQAARDLAARAGVTYPLYSDPDSTVRDALKVIGLPQTVFLNAQGTIVATERRAFRSYADLSAAIQTHLGVKP